MKLDLGGVTTEVSGVSKKDVVKKLQALGMTRDQARALVYGAPSPQTRAKKR